MGKNDYGNQKLILIFNQIADLIVLNLLFVISCIPVITIGTSLISLFTVIFERMKNPDTYIGKTYINAFKKNLKQGTLLWLMVMAVLGILYADTRILSNVKSGAAGMLIIILAVFLLLVVMMVIYVFPLQARCPDKIKMLLRNSLFISIAYLPYSLLLLGIFVICVVITFWNASLLQEMIFIWLLGGFSAMAYLQAKIINVLLEKIQ